MGIIEFRIKAVDHHPAVIISKTPVPTIQGILSRLGIEYERGFPREIYAAALYDAVWADRAIPLRILPGSLTRFLLMVWENDTVDLEMDHLDYIQYLSMLGFLYSRNGRDAFAAADIIYYSSDMKERFYFFLKSRQSRAAMEAYDLWEQVIWGLMCYYGLAEIRDLHQSFLRVLGKDNISYEDFASFIKERCSLWTLGTFLRSYDRQSEYFQHHSVKDPGQLMRLRSHDQLPYYIPDQESCVGLCKMGGLDRSWDGFVEFVEQVSDQLQDDYVSTNVIVLDVIELVQNGCSFQELRKQFEDALVQIRRTGAGDWSGPKQDKKMGDRKGQKGKGILTEKDSDIMTSLLRRLYMSVPLFPLMGYSRSAYQRRKKDRARRKRKKAFTMINGGKGKGNGNGK